MNDLVQVRKNIEDINNKISEAVKKSGRKKEEITVVAVTKTFPIEAWKISIQAGLFAIAENRVKETEIKYDSIIKGAEMELHLIGHLQSNKVRKAVKMFDIIQTVDSIRLAKKINIIAKENNKIQDIYIQVNSGKDPNKTGFCLEKIFENIKIISLFENLKIKGIMTIPPKLKSQEKLRNIYKKTKNIRDKVYSNIVSSCTDLSMGMTNDYNIAIEEGATHVRIGTGIFGSRKL